MSNIAFTVTNAGRALALNQGSQQLALSLTHMVLSGTAYPGGTDLAAVTTVPSRLEKTAIDASAEIAVGVLDMTAVFPEYVSAPYGAMVLGLYAGDPDAGGTLFAVHNASSAFITRGMFSYALSFSLDLTGSGLSNVTVQVSQNAAIAQALMQTHQASEDPHPQYATLADLAAQVAALQAAVAAAVPTGGYMMFDLTSAPTGYLAADGGLFVSANYPNLADALGSRHEALFGAAPTGYTRLPDARAMVLRGIDLGRNIDPALVLGSYMTDQVGGHTHTYVGTNTAVPGGAEGGGRDTLGVMNLTTDSNNPTGENRVKSLQVLICIKT